MFNFRILIQLRIIGDGTPTIADILNLGRSLLCFKQIIVSKAIMYLNHA